jgi:hypothetical protein
VTCDLERSYCRLHDRLTASGFRGYEFDDILGSPLVRRLTGDNLLLQRLAIQAGRRSVVNFRGIVGVKKLESSKAFGFFARGFLFRFLQTSDQRYLDLAKDHLLWLENNYCRDYSGMSWGNAFDFASRGGFIPRGLPTVVWTSHIGETFDLAYSVTGETRYRDMVVGIGHFVIENLKRLEDDSGVCIGYTPTCCEPIHNSNLLGAAALLRAWAHNRCSAYRDLAMRAIRWSCSRINPDGSWYYGTGDKYGWIDNFHTAYNLDCLVAAREIGGEEAVDGRIIDSTYGFWLRNFFLPGGKPKYYSTREYPVDIQCASQAIETLSKYSERDPQALGAAVKVAGWTIDHMQKKNGAFIFRKGRVLTNGLESIHWGQSTMLSALGCLLWKLGKSGTGVRL